MLIPEKLSFGYLTPPASYFYRATEFLLENRLRNESFQGKLILLVSSTDVFWATEHLSLERFCEYFHPNLSNCSFIQQKIVIIILPSEYSREVALSVLSECDHVVMSVGTFGWWAALLASLSRSVDSRPPPTVVYYSRQVKPGSTLASRFVYSDYFPPEWISISH